MRRLLALGLACLLLSGCWDRYEINELLVLQAIGADWQQGQVVLTAEAINPRATSVPGQAAGGPPREAQTLLITGHGPSPADAVADLDNVSTRHVFWSSADVLVIGQDLARHGMRPLLDQFVRNPKLPMTPRVIITTGTARAALSQRVSGEEISLGRMLFLRAQSDHLDESSGWAPHIYDLVRWDAEEDRAALVFGMQPVPPPVPAGPLQSTEASAVLYRDQEVAMLPRAQVRLALWLTGRFVHGVFGFACPGRPDTRGGFRVLAAKVTTRPVIAGGRLERMDVSLSGRAGLVESPCGGATLARLQQAATAELEREAQQTIAAVQHDGYDVFGWGEATFRAAPALWRQRYAADWRSAFSRLPVRLQVRLDLPYTGETTA